VDHFETPEMILEGLHKTIGEHCDSIFLAFAFADDKGGSTE
jgi:hypothetical protein